MLFYTLIIVVFGLFIFSVAYRIGGIRVSDYLFEGVIFIFCLNLIIIGVNSRRKIKKMNTEDKKQFMRKQVNYVYVLITIAAFALIVSVIYKLQYGIIMSTLFMASLCIWELGAYLGYRTLLKSNQ